jgi:hypothetical protein
VIIEGEAPTDRPIIPVQITGAMLYDLVGRLADGSHSVLPSQALEKHE